MTRRILRILGTASCAVLLQVAAFTPTAFAQDDGAQPENVLVTGSRIRQAPLEEKAPILTLTSDDIAQTGLTSLGDLLQRISTSGSPLTTRFNSSGNFGFPPDGGGIGAGAATVDLRNLGSRRTLVLVDGIRWVNESSASGVGSATDLNSIPLSIIERIEVLEDGASSIYGSDAIAGVVNVITKKNFEGMDAYAYVGGYEEGGETTEAAISFGTRSDDTSMFFNIGYVDQDRMNARDIPQSATPIPFVTDGTGGSSGTPQGRFFFFNPSDLSTSIDCTLNDGVVGLGFFDPADPCGAGDDFNPFDTGDRFNFSQFNLVLTPSERRSIYGQVEHALTDNTTFYIKGLYNNRESTNQAAPEPIFIGPDAGNGNILDTVSVDVTNPFNPFGFTLNADPSAGPVNFVFAGRRPLEGGPRIFQQNVDTWYLAGGLMGQFDAYDRNFFWDANLIWSQNQASQIKNGGYNARRIKQALGPLDDCINDPPCTPLNFFGGQGDGSGTITQDMLNFIAITQKDESEQELVDFTANLSGEIAELPGGMLGFAIGIEHREQDGFFQPDAIVVAGDTAGIPAQPTKGGFDVDEFYAELAVPLLSEVPGADLLDFSVAVRNSDYSTFGSETTSKFGVRWRPTADVLVRGTFGEGFRAPNIGELFGSLTRFDQTIADPCSGIVPGTTPQSTIDACGMLGVPTDGSYVQFNPQISVLTGGNKDLKPETADSKTLSLVYNPSGWVDNVEFIDDVSFEVTLWDYEVDGAIAALDAEIQLQACVATLDPTLCGDISRTPSGVINRFENQLSNIGGIETNGWDLNVTYASPEYEIGQFAASWTNSFLDEYVQIVPTSSGFTSFPQQGTENGDPERGYPEWRSNLSVDWMRGEWGATWNMRYIDEITETCGLTGTNAMMCTDPTNDKNDLDATMYNDFQVSYTPEDFDGLTIAAGINNVFEEDPPTCFSCALNGFDAAIYDVPGRFLYLRVGYTK